MKNKDNNLRHPFRLNHQLAQVALLIVTWLGLHLTLPAKAASLQLVPNWGASGVSTNVSMYVHVPDNVVPNPPVLVLLHYWGGSAASVFAQAQGGGSGVGQRGL